MFYLVELMVEEKLCGYFKVGVCVLVVCLCVILVMIVIVFCIFFGVGFVDICV